MPNEIEKIAGQVPEDPNAPLGDYGVDEKEVIFQRNWYSMEDYGQFDNELQIVRYADGKKIIRVGAGYGLDVRVSPENWNEFDLLNEPDLNNLPPDGEISYPIFVANREDDIMALNRLGFEINSNPEQVSADESQPRALF